MGRLAHAVAAVVVVLIVVVPVVQLMSPVSSTVIHQLSAKTATRSSSGSRLPVVTGDTTPVPHHVAFAGERVDPLDGPLSLPGFTVDLFVPPRA